MHLRRRSPLAGIVRRTPSDTVNGGATGPLTGLEIIWVLPPCCIAQ